MYDSFVYSERSTQKAATSKSSEEMDADTTQRQGREYASPPWIGEDFAYCIVGGFSGKPLDSGLEGPSAGGITSNTRSCMHRELFFFRRHSTFRSGCDVLRTALNNHLVELSNRGTTRPWLRRQSAINDEVCCP